MKIVFMGTPQFAVPALEKIFESGHEIGYVVTQPDKARDRGKKVQSTPVKEKAEKLGIKVLSPEKIKNNEDFLQTLKEYNADLIIVAAYGKILPKVILDMPRLGCINIHGSLLPRWRGAAPIQHAILSGDVETGITLMYMAEGLDTGDMLIKRSTTTESKTAGEIFEELATIGANLLQEFLPEIEAGNIKREVQNEELATYAHMIFKKDGEVDFSKDCYTIERLVRGLNPQPGAFTYYKGEILKIWSVIVDENIKDEEPGKVLGESKGGIEVATGNGSIIITELQMPGKKRVSVSDFLKGNKIEKDTIFGQEICK